MAIGKNKKMGKKGSRKKTYVLCVQHVLDVFHSLNTFEFSCDRLPAIDDAHSLHLCMDERKIEHVREFEL